ncbi:PaaI family thioesterase [Candidatus Acetothermia bacterium]|nr:PaaI family thioesterase [Candidatus Acetothermia bacterium]
MPSFKTLIEDFKAGKFPQPPVAKLVDFRLAEMAEGMARMEMDTDERHWNPMGTLHGGVICDIADAAMGMAFATTLEEGQSFTTIELKVNFLRPVIKSHLVATGKVVTRGRTIGLVECEVVDEGGKLVAKAASTCMVLKNQM